MAFWDDYNDPGLVLAENIAAGQVNLEEIIQHSECLGLMRDENPSLVEYLKQPEIYRRLIQYTLQPETKDLPYKDQYTLAHRACEVLAYRVDAFQNAIMDDDESLRNVFDFLKLNEKEQHSHLVVSFFSKIMLTLYSVNPELIVQTMKNSEFIRTLVSNLKYGALSELMINLMFNAPPSSHEDFRDLLISSNVGMLLLNELVETTDTSTARNISIIWSDFVKHLREGVYNLNLGEDVLLNQLTAPNVVSKLLVAVLDTTANMNTVPHILDVLIVLTEREFDLALPSFDFNHQPVDDRLRGIPSDQDFSVEEVVAPFLGKILLLVDHYVVVEDASDIVVSVLKLAENILNTSSPARRHILRDGLIEGKFVNFFALVRTIPTWSIMTHSVSLIVGFLLHAAPSDDGALIEYVLGENGLNLLAILLISINEFLTQEDKQDENSLEYFSGRNFWFRLAERIDVASEYCRNAMVVKRAIEASSEAENWSKFVETHLKPYISSNREDSDDNNTTLSSLPCNLSVDEVEVEMCPENGKSTIFDDFSLQNTDETSVEICTPTASTDVPPGLHDLSLNDNTNKDDQHFDDSDIEDAVFDAEVVSIANNIMNEAKQTAETKELPPPSG